MIDRDRFVAEGRPRWVRLEELLAAPPVDAASWSELAALYRSLATDLSRARGEDLSGELQTYLDDLAGRAHNTLYSRRARGGLDPWRFLAQRVPRQVRASWPFVLLSMVLFYGPWLACMAGAFASEDFALQVVDAQTLRQVEQAYSDPTDDRSLADAAKMTGFYVNNNVGIAFRCFATGILAGLGSVFFLVVNGATLGTTFGYLAARPAGWNLLEFVSGHSAWELTGIVIAGAAGLRMGWSLIATHGRTRLGSLRASAPELFLLVMGSAAMLFVAAAIEGLWSASPLPFGVKLAFGAVQIVAVIAWLSLGGRQR